MEKEILSRYNYFKEIGNFIVGVNLISEILFTISREKYCLLLKYSDNLELLKKENMALFSLMQKVGVISTHKNDQSFYENSLLRRRRTIFGDPQYRLTINPTLNCNFSCWYCYELHNIKCMDRDTKMRVERFIDNTVKRKDIRHFDLDWFGGEPLLCYSDILKPITEYAHDLCTDIGVSFVSGMTTNGYLIKSDMLDFFRKVNMQSFQITLDGVEECHNKIRHLHNGKGSYRKIVENISLLARELSPKNLCLRINYTSDTFFEIENIIDSFQEDVRPRIKVLLQQVWQDEEKNKISVKDICELRDKFCSAGFLPDEKSLNYCGKISCYADAYNQSVINYDGRVFKCTALNFEQAKEDGILVEDGSIEWNSSFAHKMIFSTFENSYCRECNLLPVCYGPCHKKTTFVLDGDDFKQYCLKGGVQDTLDIMMERFEKSDKLIASLSDYYI